VSADEQTVLAAADACVGAFGRHDRDAYFACFAPDATFIFHTTPGVLVGRSAWEAEWDRLVADDGFRVLACASSDRRVQLAGDAAIFTHRVATRALFGGKEVDADERETIVFARQGDGSWLAVHEHLSPIAV
jgi:ketosteroid isomerase-like protein